MSQPTQHTDPKIAANINVKKRSDRVMNLFLPAYFLVGLGLAFYYDTWSIALGVGGLLLVAYYSVKKLLPGSDLYQYVLSAVIGVYMAQFIYQMHGMFEMHFFAFIGCALLITYQNWKLQIPLLAVVVIHHAIFSRLQDTGHPNVYFTQLDYFDLQTFIFHILLTAVISFICGLWAYQLKKYNEIQIIQTIEVEELKKEALLTVERKRNAEMLEERNTILESIADAFFAVDKDWTVTYWNSMAEKIFQVPRSGIINRNLWDTYPGSVGSLSYQKYHEAIRTMQPVHFEYRYLPFGKWYEINAYPSESGLSVYAMDITERKMAEILLSDSEQKYSELFQLSPLPKWVFDLETLKFLDVNEAAIKKYGYSEEEFLNMTIKDIRPKQDMPLFENAMIKARDHKSFVLQGTYRHQKKNGDIINVDLQTNNIMYKGRNARVAIANDVTERMQYIKAIEEQNEKLREISWLQSHVVRAPLARIMGLVGLIKEPTATKEERMEYMDHIVVSANELDAVIHDITDKTKTIDDLPLK